MDKQTQQQIPSHNEVTSQADGVSGFDEVDKSHSVVQDSDVTDTKEHTASEDTGDNTTKRVMSLRSTLSSKGPFLSKTPYTDTPTIPEEPSNESKILRYA